MLINQKYLQPALSEPISESERMRKRWSGRVGAAPRRAHDETSTKQKRSIHSSYRTKKNAEKTSLAHRETDTDTRTQIVRQQLTYRAKKFI